MHADEVNYSALLSQSGYKPSLTPNLSAILAIAAIIIALMLLLLIWHILVRRLCLRSKKKSRGVSLLAWMANFALRFAYLFFFEVPFLKNLSHYPSLEGGSQDRLQAGLASARLRAKRVGSSDHAIAVVCCRFNESLWDKALQIRRRWVLRCAFMSERPSLREAKGWILPQKCRRLHEVRRGA